MSKNKNKSIVHKKRIILAVLGSVVIVVLLIILFRHKRTGTELPTSGKPEGRAIVNLNGPTVEEQKSGDTAKDKVIEDEKTRNQPSTPTSNGKTSVTPTVTYADQYGQQVEVGAFVSNVFEDGGICKLVMSKGTLTQATQVTAIKGATSVNCPVMTISNSKLETGTWQAIVTYASSSSEGSSTPRSVEVK